MALFLKDIAMHAWWAKITSKILHIESNKDEWLINGIVISYDGASEKFLYDKETVYTCIEPKDSLCL